MDASKFKRIFSLFKRIFSLIAAVVLILAFGCGKAALDDQAIVAAPTEVVEADPDAAEDSDSENANYSGVYNVDETTDESASGSYASSEADTNAVLVQNAGVLTMTSADINKTGDAEDNFSAGQNAAIVVVSMGQMSLLSSNVTTNARGGFGLYAAGTGSVLTINESYVYTSGESSPALVVYDGGAVIMKGGSLSTEGMDSPCVLLSGGKVTLKNVTLNATNKEFMRVLSGANELTLDKTAMTATPIIGESSTLKLSLLNGAAYSGELGVEPPAKVSVTLDASSKLTLAADTYLVALVNANLTHQNIQSNGFSLYYDSNVAENAYLNNQSYALPGGGSLVPII
jgi:hypothetical protein